MKFIIENCETSGKQMKNLPQKEQSPSDNSHCFYNITNPSNKIQCDDCKRQISKNAKILTPDCDFCVSCFSNVEAFPQEYHVINKLDYPLLDQDWTADEELMLFQGLEKHGLGNWEDISNLIGTKSSSDVEVHYLSYFLDSPDFIPTAKVISVRDQTGKLTQSGSEESKRLGKPLTRIVSSHSMQSYHRGSLTVNQMTLGMKTGTNPAEIVGYMPKRGDFEVQFDNDAELLLAEMEFNDDDSQEQIKMKFRLIDIYNQKLTERVRRKEFVISRKLLDIKEQIRLDKTRTKEEKEIYNMMKVFARFSNPEEHDKLVQGIIKEKQIRSRLEELKDLKKKGFKSLVDLNQELEGKKKKEERTKKDPIFLTTDRHRPTPATFSHKKSKKQFSLEKSEQKVASPSPEQQQLCRRFDLSTAQYLTIKETLVRESLHQDILQLDPASKIFKVHRNKVQSILDFVVQKESLRQK